MGKVLIGIVVLILLDGIMSWFLYLQSPSYNGLQQTFWRDLWGWLVRMICAVTIIIMGAVL